jgi:hypothetical protein
MIGQADNKAPDGFSAQLGRDILRPSRYKAASGVANASPSSVTLMTTEPNDRTALLAPCGMDCAVCSGYLAYTHQLPKHRGAISHCQGCRARSKHCAYLKSHCVPLSQHEVTFCHECADFPCARLQKFDARYRSTYGFSPIESLTTIATSGTDALIAEQQLRCGCPKCGDLRSVHNGRCYGCETVRHWRDG